MAKKPKLHLVSVVGSPDPQILLQWLIENRALLERGKDKKQPQDNATPRIPEMTTKARVKYTGPSRPIALGLADDFWTLVEPLVPNRTI